MLTARRSERRNALVPPQPAVQCSGVRECVHPLRIEQLGALDDAPHRWGAEILPVIVRVLRRERAEIVRQIPAAPVQHPADGRSRGRSDQVILFQERIGEGRVRRRHLLKALHATQHVAAGIVGVPRTAVVRIAPEHLDGRQKLLQHLRLAIAQRPRKPAADFGGQAMSDVREIERPPLRRAVEHGAQPPAVTRQVLVRRRVLHEGAGEAGQAIGVPGTRVEPRLAQLRLHGVGPGRPGQERIRRRLPDDGLGDLGIVIEPAVEKLRRSDEGLARGRNAREPQFRLQGFLRLLAGLFLRLVGIRFARALRLFRFLGLFRFLWFFRFRFFRFWLFRLLGLRLFHGSPRRPISGRLK